MKKIFSIVGFALFFLNAFAFEGIIEQVYTDPVSKETSTFVWFIEGDKVRLDIKKADEVLSILPDTKNLSLSIYGNKADAEGNFWYASVPLSQIQVEVPKLRLLETLESDYKGEKAMDLKLMSPEGLLMVQFLERISVNITQFATYFAESVEFQALQLAGVRGFPVSSIIMDEEGAIYTLVTQSIQEKSLADSEFLVPSKYKLFSEIK
jgi:hypothetical protein